MKVDDQAMEGRKVSVIEQFQRGRIASNLVPFDCKQEYQGISRRGIVVKHHE
jgi:hypothetical protein